MRECSSFNVVAFAISWNRTFLARLDNITVTFPTWWQYTIIIVWIVLFLCKNEKYIWFHHEYFSFVRSLFKWIKAVISTTSRSTLLIVLSIIVTASASFIILPPRSSSSVIALSMLRIPLRLGLILLVRCVTFSFCSSLSAVSIETNFAVSASMDVILLFHARRRLEHNPPGTFCIITDLISSLSVYLTALISTKGIQSFIVSTLAI